jgi:Flp pilus assembly protein TadG
MMSLTVCIHRASARRQKGAVAVEFGLLLPLIIALILITVDLGRMAYHHNILVKSVREAGRYLSTQLPGSGTVDKAIGGGNQTTWTVATNMVLAYAADLCPGSSPTCLTASMVSITDAKNTNETTSGSTPASLLVNVPFGQGQQNMVRISVKGYRLPSLFAGYVLTLVGATEYVYPTVSATFVQF